MEMYLEISYRVKALAQSLLTIPTATLQKSIAILCKEAVLGEVQCQWLAGVINNQQRTG